MPLKQLDENYVPKVIQLPSTSVVNSTRKFVWSNVKSERFSKFLVCLLQENGIDNTDGDDSMDIDDTYKRYTSPEQLANELITLSLLPESRWKNLVDLDIIRV